MASLPEMQDLSPHVSDIEDSLSHLDEALRSHDFSGIALTSMTLHQALVNAMAAFRHAQQLGQNSLPNELKQRLILAQARVSGVQSAVHRTSASLQRTLDVLLERNDDAQSAAYLALGTNKSVASSLKAYSS